MGDPLQDGYQEDEPMEGAGDEVMDDGHDFQEEEEEESFAASKKSGSFTILGDHKAQEKKAVQRILPNWLQYPKVITSKDVKQFSDLKELDKGLVKKLHKNGITQCFPVQWTVVPELLAQCRCGLYAGDAGFRPRDVCVSAPTGSGKTLTFVLPVIQALKDRVVPRVRALVVLPVRDLALQVYNVFLKYCEDTQLKVCLLGGKMDFLSEQKHLVSERSHGNSTTEEWRSNVDIVIATKGRLLDHIDRTEGFDLSHLRFLVVDEADRLMTDINDNWLSKVEQAAYAVKPCVFTPYDRSRQDGLTTASCRQGTMHMQKLLFSATLSLNPDKLEQMSLFLPLLFTVTPPGSTPAPPTFGATAEPGNGFDQDQSAISDQLQECYVDCAISEKPLILLHFMLTKKYQHVLCFTNSVETTNRLYLVLKQVPDIRVEQLTSSIHPNTRRRIIKEFESGQVQLLISSDIMTRGMDIQNVECVVSYDMPAYIETYIHRVGRTARANKSGCAVSLVDGTEMPDFEKLLTDAGRWERLKIVKVKKKRLEPLLPAYTKALKLVPKILRNQKAKKRKAIK